MEEIEREQRNYESYWSLVSAIQELCHNALDSDYLFTEDIYSALDRVKYYFITDYTEFRMEARLADAGILMREYEELKEDEISKKGN